MGKKQKTLENIRQRKRNYQLGGVKELGNKGIGLEVVRVAFRDPFYPKKWLNAIKIHSVNKCSSPAMEVEQHCQLKRIRASHKLGVSLLRRSIA